MDINKLAEITNGIILKDTKRTIKNIVIDTRILNDNDVFIPIKGKNLDGNNYIMDAINKNASIVFVATYDYEEITKDVGIIKINDGIEALKNICKYILNDYKGTIIGVTGSVGKTTTKELLYSILSSKYKVFKTEKNYNNIIGMCQSILSLKDEDFAIFELGMNHIGEIKEMVEVLKPSIGIITNIGSSHIGYLGSKEKIYEAKLELIHPDLKYLVISKKDNYLNKTRYENIIWVEEEKYIIEDDGIIYDDVNIDICGKHNIDNLNIVIKLAKFLGLNENEIKEGLKKYKDIRIKKKYINGALIIDDSYNASLESMKTGIDYINSLNYNYKILVLGDMLELGSDSMFYHKDLGKYIKDKDIDKVYTYGDESKYIGYTCNKISNHYTDKELLVKDLKEELTKDVVIYFKASRGIKLEEIIDKL